MFIELTSHENGVKFSLNPDFIVTMVVKDNITIVDLLNGFAIEVKEPPWRIALEVDKLREKSLDEDERIGQAAFNFLRNNADWIRKIFIGEKV